MPGIPLARPQASFDKSLLWYVSYGSNLRFERLNCYLKGGVPAGGAVDHPGARDTRPPRDVRPFDLPGGLYFGGKSMVWTGGIAYYDPSLPGTAPGRAYLITREQLSDIITQERFFAGGPAIGGTPGHDYDFEPALLVDWYPLGPGPYETLVHAGDLDGYPVLTFTGPLRAAEAEFARPSGRYMLMIVEGLAEARGWSTAEAAAYLCSLPGAAGTWTPDEVVALTQDLSSVEGTGPA